jgi:hypothetical protein
MCQGGITQMKPSHINQRELMPLAAGASAPVLASCADKKHPAPAVPGGARLDTLVPRRPFGRTGVSVSKLCLGGGAFGPALEDAQGLIQEALKLGVDCWEISLFGAKMYGEYFKTHPDARQRVFLTGKTSSKDPAAMQAQLDQALEDAGTSWIDFFAIHTVDNVGVLTDDIRRWAERAKKEGTIRFFGFCTHVNMDKCLGGAADLGWIDGIQTFYNHRMQSVPSMEDAIGKCHDKGIGIIAVKSMALCVQTKAALQELPLHEASLQPLLAPHGVTFEQAKLRAIWQNPALTSVCSLMSDAQTLQSNAEAAMDERPLPGEVAKGLSDYANGTARFFCRRCSDLCEAANADRIPISAVMQLLMMSRAYEGHKELCVKLFSRLPLEVRRKMPTSDYSAAEELCPQRMSIAQLMKDAYREMNA